MIRDRNGQVSYGERNGGWNSDRQRMAYQMAQANDHDQHGPPRPGSRWRDLSADRYRRKCEREGRYRDYPPDERRRLIDEDHEIERQLESDMKRDATDAANEANPQGMDPRTLLAFIHEYERRHRHEYMAGVRRDEGDRDSRRRP